jgi:hypothetical protein
MNKYVITAAAALLLGGTAFSTVQAQDAEPAQQELPKKPGAGPATEAAPGQKQKSGETGSATEAAPGQQQKSGDSTAQEAAPGQVKKQDETTSGGKPTPNQSTTSTAPEQPKKSDQINTNEAAPGQEKKDDQTTDNTKPSSETTASIDISAEQRTQIRDVIVERKAKPVDIDIEVNVGVVVPRTIVLTPLPPRVIEIVPAYSGYEYFVLADGRIVIVEPGTLKVVYILVV